MPKWTPDQQTAIDDRGGALLVSAAAGSGKTAVLTERVLRRLTDENDPVDIDRLLLVTFTNAAAAEMRERDRCGPRCGRSRKSAGYPSAAAAVPRAPRENHDCACAVPVARARAGGGARHRARLSPDGRKRGQAASRRGARKKCSIRPTSRRTRSFLRSVTC